MSLNTDKHNLSQKIRPDEDPFNPSRYPNRARTFKKSSCVLRRALLALDTTVGLRTDLPLFLSLLIS